MAEADVNTVDESTPGESPGSILLRARNEQQLGLEEIATRLHLQPGIVQALEQDDDDSLPAPTYVRGYLRAYAAILGISADELITGYNRRTKEDSLPLRFDAPQATSAIHKFGPDSKRLWIIGAASVGLLVIVVLILLLTDGKNDKGETPVLANNEQPVKPAAGSSGHPEAEKTALPKKKTVKPGKPPSAAVVLPKPVPGKPEPAARKADPARKKAAPVVGGSDIITIRFNEASWVDIRDANGKRLLFRTARPGSSYRLSGSRPFRVFLGNAPGVSLTFNNRPVDLKPFTRRSKTARLRLGE